MTEKSLAETFPLTKENLAAMLAIVGKEENNGQSPTAQVMLQNLGKNLRILFDNMCSRDADFAMVRVGCSYALDDNFYEYVKVPKVQGVTKIKALAETLNTLQQTFATRHLHLAMEDESSDGYEFVIEVRDY